jgi:hypothetical protein
MLFQQHTSLGKRPVSACALARKRIIVWHKKKMVSYFDAKVVIMWSRNP